MIFKPLLLLPLAAQALGAAVPKPDQQQNANAADGEYDAIVIGGGPAGLSALSGLARVRRNVLLIDSGEYRNQPTRHMHDVIGFDGVTPAYYRTAARDQIAHYDTVTMTNGTVTAIKDDTPQGSNNTLFTVTSSSPNGTAAATHRARKVVLATGLRDLLPSTPGIQENWGRGIFWCPWCDGHEHADQGLGFLAGFEEIAGLVREVATLNSDVVAFVNGTDTPEARAAAEASFPRFESYLALKNVTVYNQTISAVTRLHEADPTDPNVPTAPENDLFQVEFADGSAPVERNAFLVSYPDEQRSTIGADLGVRLDGGRLAADASKGYLSNIKGVYAVGDANADNSTNVPHALYTGKKAAVFLHVQLEREIAQDQIDEWEESHEKRDEEHRAVWERMNGDEGDILHAGDYDAFEV
ncbi:hypothetical protein N3K66_002970 [Trichothecium roseum]|uniref:Uncharacterized protein n=1 Tax=Trichothecium roseum TaxID=47278 RepID=A0ACC0V4L8_9HYPO|nr:hypothetical protein N3K66_002970 [Trichothecium roseum]